MLSTIPRNSGVMFSQRLKPDLYIDSDKKTLTSSDSEKANVLADFFSSVFTEEDDLEMPELDINPDIPKLDILNISAETIKKKLDNLTIDKSPGPDNIHPRILRELSNILSEPLSIIYSNSYTNSVCPDEWRCANVIALFKKGDHKYAGNYRPVSLTCIVCKVLETIVRVSIVNHMQVHKLYSNKQFGFISGRSTVLQLLKVLDRWTEILDEGGCIDVAYCDFMKAFDKVPHRRLLHKLQMYGIGENYIQWIGSFLLNCKQKVSVNGESSEWKSVTSGIPQGSVLGTVLFVLYINDLPDAMEFASELYLYADDTKIFKEIYKTSDCEDIQKDMHLMHAWSEKWMLKFHPDKCKTMRIGRSKVEKHEYTLKADLKPMDETISEKDVGVTINYLLISILQQKLTKPIL
jgi:hypothetical protein